MAILRCTGCGSRTEDTTGTCDNCGREIDGSFEWIGGTPSTYAASNRPTEELGTETRDTSPGAAANTVLRVVAIFTLLVCSAGGLLLWAEVGDAISVAIVAGLLVQGVVTSALLFAFAGVGDNLIAIRRSLDAENRRLETHQ